MTLLSKLHIQEKLIYSWFSSLSSLVFVIFFLITHNIKTQNEGGQAKENETDKSNER